LTATGREVDGAISLLPADFPSGLFVGKSVMICAKGRRTPYLSKAGCHGSAASLD